MAVRRSMIPWRIWLSSFSETSVPRAAAWAYSSCSIRSRRLSIWSCSWMDEASAYTSATVPPALTRSPSER